MQSAEAGGPLTISVLPHLQQEDVTPMVVLKAQLKELCQDGLRRLVALDHAVLVKKHHVPCRQWHQLSSGTALFGICCSGSPAGHAIRLSDCSMLQHIACGAASRLSHGPAQTLSIMLKVSKACSIVKERCATCVHPGAHQWKS